MKVDGELQGRLELLARHLEAFTAPEFSFGEVEPAWTDRGGVTHLGWYRLSAGAESFLADVRAGGWVRPFDWMAWMKTPRGRELSTDLAAVGAASPEELRHLLTAIIRSDRFNDASMAGAFESGLLTAIVRRARALLG